MPDLIVNSSNIFPQQSRTYQLNPTQKQDCQERSNMAGSECSTQGVEMKECAASCNESEEQRQRQNQTAQGHSKSQGFIAEAEDCIHGVLEKLQQGLLRGTCGTVGTVVINKRRGKPYPCAQAGKIPVSFLQIDDRIGGLTI